MILNKETGKELEKKEGVYQYSFGEKKLNSSVKATLIIKGENVLNVTSTSDCDCTSASPNIIDKQTVEIDIIYKATHVTHTINRSIFINYTDIQENQLVEIKIDGQVVD